MLRKHLVPAVAATLLFVLLTGVAYPAAVTLVAQALFPRQANGSLVRRDGRVVGSALLGQSFDSARYFHPRPSAAGAGYDASASGGSNKGPTDRKLADTLIASRVARLVTEDGAVRGSVPADLATASGSGLDPHVSPAGALVQVARVAQARSASPDVVRRLVLAHTEGRQLGLLGEPRVNVLLLNVALDSLLPVRTR